MKKLLISFMIVLLLVSGCNFIFPKDEPTAVPTEDSIPVEPPTEVPVPTEIPTNTPENALEPSETLAVESSPEIQVEETEQPVVTEGEKERHVEEEAKFSYEPIEGWSLQPFPGLNTKLLIPGSDLLAYGISLVFVREDFEGTTADYAENAMAAAKEHFQDFAIGTTSEFETLSGLKVIKQTATYKDSEMDFDSIFYSIGDDAKPELPKLVVTFGRFPGAPEEVETLVESLIKSLRFED